MSLSGAGDGEPVKASCRSRRERPTCCTGDTAIESDYIVVETALPRE